MRILFVHQNFPGQFKHLAPALAENTRHEVVALSLRKAPDYERIRTLQYGLNQGNTPDIHPLAQDFESKVIRAEGVAKAAFALRQQGFYPDVIYAHPGWGETLLLKDIFPSSRLISFMEFFYHTFGADVNFDPEFPTQDLLGLARVRIKNASILLSLDISDTGISPTTWQKQQYPREYHHKIQVVHDGIDTDMVKPDPHARITMTPPGLEFSMGDEIITFVNRNLEPMRGYHRFMRALPEILRRRPRARVVIVGGNGVSYGAHPQEGTYKEGFLAEVREQLDMNRVHFSGTVSYPVFLKILQISAVHVYLTFPFVLSWSMLEAMASECLVVGSCTPPVKEVIRHGENGLLVDFFDSKALAETVIEALEHPDRMREIRKNARQTVVEEYDLRRVCLPRQIEMIEHCLD